MPTIVDKAAMNDNGSKPIAGRSTFPLNQRLAGTYRFGQYQVCYVEDTVPNDNLSVKSSHQVRSFNTKSPIMGDMKIHKEFFDVPFSVMLPLNYEKFFVQPNIGEDIDASEVGLNVASLNTKLLKQVELFESRIYHLSTQDVVDFNELFITCFYYLKYLSYVFSKGSLLTALGQDVSTSLRFQSVDEFGNSRPFSNDVDAFFDYVCSRVIHGIDAFNVQSDHSYAVKLDGTSVVVDTTNFRRFLELLYDASEITADVLIGSDDISTDDVYTGSLWNFYMYGSTYDKDMSLARPLAYQLCCAEFFTNSHIDYIYSAELYRQNVDSLLFNSDDGFGLTREHFSWNGVDYIYDTLSAHNFNAVFDSLPDPDEAGDLTLSTISKFCDLMRLVFGYNRCLRYVDYFTGSRSRPLAVGDVNVQVNAGYVNVVDTIKQRWFARFLNQVNRAGRKLSEYSRALFPGLSMSRDFHDPMWLAHISDSVGTTETANTGSAQQANQNSITSNFISNGQRFAFEYSPERYGICIGILYFDIARYYPNVIERNVFNVDRNDYFNPYLQFNGDQIVYADELFSGQSHTTFGYQGRDMQYKQKVDRCFGSISDYSVLPGWFYISPNYSGYNITPDFIRCSCTELDQFFSAFSGYSPARYFHFIVVNTNNCRASRPMVANPQLD